MQISGYWGKYHIYDDIYKAAFIVADLLQLFTFAKRNLLEAIKRYNLILKI